MPDVYFAKLFKKAVIPTKREEDAGYDLYALDDVAIAPNETLAIPTGVVCSFPKEYALILKERGSTGIRGLSIRCGVVDSGYRGEIIVVYTNVSDEPIFWSRTKAIAQGLFVPVIHANSHEVDVDTIMNFHSERGAGKLGSSGK